ncbi:SDR family oxidoreductase [Paenibacillus mesophilus]|uniref:SDR family oxidoreductase n=1 Tax=Paenibacillus mesophilus TaxID=2582849 RepID=UPI003B75D036
MGRPADPGEIAGVVAFMASPASSYMTGSLVTVDSSYTCVENRLSREGRFLRFHLPGITAFDALCAANR